MVTHKVQELVFAFPPFRLFFRPAGASTVKKTARGHLASALDEIADQVWNKDPAYWKNNERLFHPQTGIVVAYTIENGDPAGFLVYRRYKMRGKEVIYVDGINFKPEFQNRGHFYSLCQKAFQAESGISGTAPLYVVARTRHPGILSILEKLCDEVAPSAAVSPSLLQTADEIRHELFPGEHVELPSMIMRDVYAHFNYRKEPAGEEFRHRHADVFRRLGPRDAYFLVGRARRGTNQLIHQ